MAFCPQLGKTTALREFKGSGFRVLLYRGFGVQGVQVFRALGFWVLPGRWFGVKGVQGLGFRGISPALLYRFRVNSLRPVASDTESPQEPRNSELPSPPLPELNDHEPAKSLPKAWNHIPTQALYLGHCPPYSNSL